MRLTTSGGAGSGGGGGAVGGSLAGTLPNPTVAQVDGAAGNLPIKAPKTTWGATAGSEVVSQLDLVTTTDATQTTIATFAAPDDTLCDYSAVVCGFKTNGDAFRIVVEATYYRHSGGAPTIVGSVATSNQRNSAGASGWSVTYDTSSNNVRLRVTGQAASTIHWSSAMTVQKVA